MGDLVLESVHTRITHTHLYSIYVSRCGLLQRRRRPRRSAERIWCGCCMLVHTRSGRPARVLHACPRAVCLPAHCLPAVCCTPVCACMPALVRMMGADP